MFLKLRMGLSSVLFFFITTFSACSIHYKVAENKLNFEKDIVVDIQKVDSRTEQTAGSNYKLVPPRKHVFVWLTVQLTNNSNSDQLIDLTKIVLLNAENKTKYLVVNIFQPSIIPIPAKSDLKLKAKEQVKRLMMFTYPEKLRPDLVEINGSVHQVAYL
ncbi:hypothetical protein [Pedobacter sp. MC2016-24]|uniref:hypothetical protein n=1 Tax=Pedobacter sp. MC2016-24 TaxID=2780090 RepID=UPI0018818D8B|nr:hypothetical protein [Pedobacter sp. MC2016-24]MBE9601126.1 hypothetical protein [Pedobacter sp. MC2016-24]